MRSRTTPRRVASVQQPARRTVGSGITKGSDLGLAIAARLVQLMGGRIGYPDNPNRDSVFWVEPRRGAVPDAAAEIAGSAGIVGLLSAAAAARQFECAASTNAPETSVLADRLVAEITASMQIVRHELATLAVAPA